MRKKGLGYLAMLLCLCLCCGMVAGSGLSVAAETGWVPREQMPDDNLYGQIQEQCGRMTYEELSFLPLLVIQSTPEKPVRSLKGLELCTGLKMLMVAGVEKADLSVMTGMPNLEILVLSNCGITSLMPLTALTNLQLLLVDTNEIEDLSPIRQMENPPILGVTDNAIDMSDPQNVEYIKSMMLAYINSDFSNLALLPLPREQIDVGQGVTYDGTLLASLAADSLNLFQLPKENATYLGQANVYRLNQRIVERFNEAFDGYYDFAPAFAGCRDYLRIDGQDIAPEQELTAITTPGDHTVEMFVDMVGVQEGIYKAFQMVDRSMLAKLLQKSQQTDQPDYDSMTTDEVFLSLTQLQVDDNGYLFFEFDGQKEYFTDNGKMQTLRDVISADGIISADSIMADWFGDGQAVQIRSQYVVIGDDGMMHDGTGALVLDEDGQPMDACEAFLQQMEWSASSMAQMTPDEMTTQIRHFRVAEAVVGDLNGDGRKNMTDALALYQYASGQGTLRADQRAMAHIRGGEDITSLDALALYQEAAGLK